MTFPRQLCKNIVRERKGFIAFVDGTFVDVVVVEDIRQWINGATNEELMTLGIFMPPYQRRCSSCRHWAECSPETNRKCTVRSGYWRGDELCSAWEVIGSEKEEPDAHR